MAKKEISKKEAARREEPIEIGWLNNDNVVMTNRKFKHLKYGKESKIPPLEYKAVVEINALTFLTAIRSCGTVAESVKIVVDDPFEQGATMRLFSDGGKGSVEIKLLAKIKGAGNAKYSIDYLERVLKEYSTKDLSKMLLTLRYSTDYPIRGEFDLGDDWFIIAPRCDND